MGGVSSSRLVLDAKGEGALFEGRLRSEGGGFCGQRMRLLAEPLDLSSADCGCNAAIYLVAMPQSPSKGDCGDRYWCLPPPLEPTRTLWSVRAPAFD